MWPLTRARLRDGGLLGVLAVVVVLSALGSGIAADLGGAATAGVRAGIAGLRGAQGGYRITLPRAADAASQDRRVRAAVAGVRGPDGRAVPARVIRDLRSPAPIAFAGPHGNVRAITASITGLRGAATLVAGAWPTGAGEASLQADAARTLHVEVGDRLRLPRGGSVTVAGVWRVRDPADPRWLASDLPLTGTDDAAESGPLVIDPSAWVRTGVRPLVRWTVLPRANRMTADELPALAAAPDRVAADLGGDSPGSQLDEDGGLARAILPMEQRLQAAAAVSIAPLVLLGLVGLLTLGELVRAREHSRRDERGLLRAWGASRVRLAAWAVSDALAAVAAAALGSTLAGLLPGAGPAGVVAAAGIAAAAVTLLVLGAAGPRTRRPRRGRAARGRSITTASLTGVVVVAAVVALVQLLVYGSPLLPVAGGGTAVDPLAVSAPALAIVAIALLAVAAFPLLRRVVEPRARRGRGVGAIEALRFARRPRAALAPVLLVALATATGALAAGYSGTWLSTAERTRTAQVGTDVRVESAATLPVPSHGARSQAPAATAGVQLASQVVTMVELPADAVPQVVAPVAGAVDPAALRRDLGAAVEGPHLPAGAPTAVLTVSAEPASALPDAVDVVVRDAGGVSQTLYATRHDDAYTVPLPARRGPFTLRAVDLQLGAIDPGSTVRVTSLRAGGADIPLSGRWAPTDSRAGAEALTGAGIGVRTVVPATGIRMRVMPRGVAGARVRLVVSAPLAAAAGLRAGSRIDLPIVASGGAIPAVVAAVVPVVPGVPDDRGVLADLGAVGDALLAADLEQPPGTERWIRSSDPAAAAASLLHELPASATVTTRLPATQDAVLESARRADLVAGVVAILLAAVAITALLLDEMRRRRVESAVLRALGMRTRRLASGYAADVGGLLALGAVGGGVAGALVVPLVVPALVRTAMPSGLAAIPPAPTLDPAASLVLAATLVVGCAAAVLAMVITVGRDARRRRDGRELR